MSQSSEYPIGVIGGSGLYQMDGLTIHAERKIKTPFGTPSDAVVLGEIDGIGMAFLARHGRGHRLMPSELNYRANIYAMKVLGVEHIVSVSAVGSMKEEVRAWDTSSCRCNSSIAPATVPTPSSVTAWSPTSASPTRSARCFPG